MWIISNRIKWNNSKKWKIIKGYLKFFIRKHGHNKFTKIKQIKYKLIANKLIIIIIKKLIWVNQSIINKWWNQLL